MCQTRYIIDFMAIVKTIKYRDLLRKPKSAFPIPAEGVKVIRKEGNFYIYKNESDKKIADIKMSDKYIKINPLRTR